MCKTNRQLLLALLVALLGIFLFVGSVSADEDSTGAPAAQPTVVATDTSTQATDAVVPVTDPSSTGDLSTTVATVDTSAPAVTATPAVTTTGDDAAATLVAPTIEDTSTEVGTSPTGDISTPVAEVSATDPATVDPAAAVTTTPVTEATATATATAAPATGVSQVSVSSAGDPYFKVGAVTYAFETTSGLCPTGPGVICTLSHHPHHRRHCLYPE